MKLRLYKKSRSGVYKPLSRDEILLMVFESTKHRKDALVHSKSLTDTIIKQSLPHCENGVLDYQKLQEIIQGVLKRFDPVAEVYYTAYFANRS